MKRVYDFLSADILTTAVIMLFCIVLTRTAFTYLSDPVKLRPAESYYAYEMPGWDFRRYILQPVYEIRRGITPYIYGYSGPMALLGILSFLEAGNVCTASCAPLLYAGMIIISYLGYICLLFAMIPKTAARLQALVILAAFFLGTPMVKAVDAGNPDLILPVILGIILLCVRRLQTRRSLPIAVFLGLTMGWFLNVKAFLLPFVLAAAVTAGYYPVLPVAFLSGFGISAWWPRLYGVPAGLFDVFSFAARGANIDSRTYFTAVHYGNNAIFSYVSNVLQGFRIHTISPVLLKIFTVMGSGALGLLVFVKPLRDEKIFRHILRYMQSKKKMLATYIVSFPTTLLLCTVGYIFIQTISAWSYDYRILYILPILFAFLSVSHHNLSQRYLTLSILFLLLKCLWIPKDRILTAFLYIHFYFLLRYALVYWKSHVPAAKSRKRKARLV